MDQSPSTSDSCDSRYSSCKIVGQKAKPPAFNMEKGKGTDEVDSTGCSEGPVSDTALEESRQIKVSLLDSALWKKFKGTTNEMIVTKPGRRLFPGVMVSLSGLRDRHYYNVFFKIVSSDGSRYKYVNRKWEAVAESEIRHNEHKQIFKHPSSPNTGQFWSQRPISFKQVKISHYDTSSNGNILIHTMHKYHVEVVVVPDGQVATSLPLIETTFIAVSAYQNLDLTKLKIDNNPFAKGFRDKMRSVKARQEQVSSPSFQQDYLPSVPPPYSFIAPPPFPVPYPLYPIPTYPRLFSGFTGYPSPSPSVVDGADATTTEEESN